MKKYDNSIITEVTNPYKVINNAQEMTHKDSHYFAKLVKETDIVKNISRYILGGYDLEKKRSR